MTKAPTTPRSAAMVLLAAALTACVGQGKHTGELADAASEQMRQVRAAADYDLAYQQYNAGNFDLALQAIDNSIDGVPDSVKSHVARGRILLEMGPAKPALPSFERALELSEGDPEALYYRGIALERMDRLDDAVESYLAAHQASGDRPEYLLAGLEVLVDLDRVDDALRRIAAEPYEIRNHVGVKQLLGHISLLRGETDGAIEAFTQAVVLSPEDPVLREDLSRALLSRGRFAEAETHLASLSKTDHYQRRRDLRHMHAACLLELDRPVPARQILLALTREEGGDSDYAAWYRLSDVSLVLDDDGLLRESAMRMIHIEPDRHEGHLALAMWQRRTGDPSRALETLNKAEALSGGDPTPARLRRLVERDLSRLPAG